MRKRVESRAPSAERQKGVRRAHALDARRSTLDSALRRVRLFLCDVDGILTNGTVFMGEGREFKQFHIRDGLGLRLLQHEGIKVGWISNRPSAATAERAEDLKIDFLFQNNRSKVEAAEVILRKTGLGWANICYMGDDIVDLGVLKRAGVAMTVPDAVEEVKALTAYVTSAHAGHGAVREAVELLLRAQGKWEKLIREFSA
jgi:3-deoxy-D-manno-octulosonate 8-phosphate phosphatase (KDO 8-P phosphatase)